MRRHGTRAKFVHDGCKCFDCRFANSNYEIDRAERHRGPWQVRYSPSADHYVVRNRETGVIEARYPAAESAYIVRDTLNEAAFRTGEAGKDPMWADDERIREVRRHLRKLRDAGVGLRRVSEASGVGRSRLTELVTGRSYNGDRPRRRRLKWETAERILAVPLTAELASDGAYIPAANTWRRIRELLEAGWTKVRIAEAIGQRRALQLGRERVTKRNAEAIRRLHGEVLGSSYRMDPEASEEGRK